MKHAKWIILGFAVLLSSLLILPTGCGKKKTDGQSDMEMTKESAAKITTAELPVAVNAAIEANVPGAEISFIETEMKNNITLYDIEFTADRGEIEVAEDGTIMDVVTIVAKGDLPEAAAATIEKASEGMTVRRLEKSEIRSEIKSEGEQSVIEKLDTPRYEYEAEFVRNDSTAEITVDTDGNIVEAFKWESD